VADALQKTPAGGVRSRHVDRNIWLCSALHLGLQKIPDHAILIIPLPEI
jgi:hypothetical protein